jgi:hypothetical protein
MLTSPNVLVAGRNLRSCLTVIGSLLCIRECGRPDIHTASRAARPSVAIEATVLTNRGQKLGEGFLLFAPERCTHQKPVIRSLDHLCHVAFIQRAVVFDGQNYLGLGVLRLIALPPV